MPNRRLLLPLLAIALVSLTGCATGLSDASDVTACPVVVEYSPEFQDRLADEVEALPEGAALVQAMVDYGRLRAEVRACAK